MAKVVVFALLAIISIAQAQVKVPADGMVVKSLKIAGPQNQPAEIVLRSGGNKVVMGVKPDGSFAIGSENHPYLSVQDNMMFAHTKVLATGGLSTADNMAVGNVLQWALIHSEDFADGAQGWGEQCTLTCSSSTHKSDKDCLAEVSRRAVAYVCLVDTKCSQRVKSVNDTPSYVVTPKSGLQQTSTLSMIGKAKLPL